MPWLTVALMLLWTQLALAQGYRSDPWSPICTLGTEAADGCDAIRHREILDAATQPWRAIGRVNFASRAQRSHCTGVLVSERHVLTAAHCLYNADRKRWIPPSSIRFAAGYQRGQAEAASAVAAYRLHSGQERGQGFENSPDLDWAVLELADPIGRQVGFLETISGTESSAFVAGYAGLRPHVLSKTKACSVQPSRTGLLRATCPVMMGDSGAPLLVPSDAGPKVAAILSRIAPTQHGIDALFLSVDLFDAD